MAKNYSEKFGFQSKGFYHLFETKMSSGNASAFLVDAQHKRHSVKKKRENFLVVPFDKARDEILPTVGGAQALAGPLDQGGWVKLWLKQKEKKV